MFHELRSSNGAIFAGYRLVDTQLDTAVAGGKTKSVITGLKQLLRQAEDLSDPFLVAFGHHYVGLAYVSRKDPKNAIPELQKAIRIRKQIGDHRHADSSNTLVAQALAQQGKFSEAMALAEEVYTRQMSEKLRAAAYRTLLSISYVQQLQHGSAAEDFGAVFRTKSPYYKIANSFSRRFSTPTVGKVPLGGMVLHT
jgi:hypothetical protein